MYPLGLVEAQRLNGSKSPYDEDSGVAICDTVICYGFIVAAVGSTFTSVTQCHTCVTHMYTHT